MTTCRARLRSLVASWNALSAASPLASFGDLSDTWRERRMNTIALPESFKLVPRPASYFAKCGKHPRNLLLLPREWKEIRIYGTLVKNHPRCSPGCIRPGWISFYVSVKPIFQAMMVLRAVTIGTICIPCMTVELIKSQHLGRFEIGHVTRKSRDAPFNLLHAMTRINWIDYNDR